MSLLTWQMPVHHGGRNASRARRDPKKSIFTRVFYAGALGPQYESRAEVKMLRSLGEDAIGTSTVCETIQARAFAMEVAGFPFLTSTI
jgi:purine nucleoside phosphorylase